MPDAPTFWTITALDPLDPSGCGTIALRLSYAHTDGLRLRRLDARFARIMLIPDQSAELIAHIKAHPPVGDFSPCAYYGAEEDALVFYFRNDPDYGKRINSQVTIYLSMGDNELVGCQIKGVGRVLRELGDFDVTITHGKVKLKVVLLAFMDRMLEGPDTRDVYREVYRRAAEADVELNVPELV